MIPFDTTTIIIATAEEKEPTHMQCFARCRLLLGIINNDNNYRPSCMGLERAKILFVCHEIVYFGRSDVGWDYIYNIENFYSVTHYPQIAYPPAHWPIPKTQNKETGINDSGNSYCRNTLDYPEIVSVNTKVGI